MDCDDCDWIEVTSLRDRNRNFRRYMCGICGAETKEIQGAPKILEEGQYPIVLEVRADSPGWVRLRFARAADDKEISSVRLNVQSAYELAQRCTLAAMRAEEM